MLLEYQLSSLVITMNVRQSVGQWTLGLTSVIPQTRVMGLDVFKISLVLPVRIKSYTRIHECIT